MADRGHKVLLLTVQVDLLQPKSVDQGKPAYQQRDQGNASPGNDGVAGVHRDAARRQDELDVGEGRCQAVAIEQDR